MARINVEDELFADFRFQDLCSTLGDIEKALGKMVRLWIVAQKYWVDNQALIPFQVFEKGPWEACLNAGLVEKRDTGYYVCGSEKQFSWLTKASEAGKKSAKNRQEKYGTSQPLTQNVEGPSNDLRTTLEGRLKVSEPLTLTPTPTLILSTHTSNKDLIPESPLALSSDEDVCVLDKIWNEHCGTLPKVLRVTSARKRHMKARWKENPDEAYWVSIAKTLASSPFCKGETGGSWVADFEYFLKPNTHLKVSEGQYRKPQVQQALQDKRVKTLEEIMSED